MTYEYTIEFVSLEQIPPTGEVSGEAGNKVYVCDETGECAIRDFREEQMGYLQSSMNDMGSKGWELVQVLFNRKGAVSFWKRTIAEKEVKVRVTGE